MRDGRPADTPPCEAKLRSQARAEVQRLCENSSESVFVENATHTIDRYRVFRSLGIIGQRAVFPQFGAFTQSRNFGTRRKSLGLAVSLFPAWLVRMNADF